MGRIEKLFLYPQKKGTQKKGVLSIKRVVVLLALGSLALAKLKQSLAFAAVVPSEY